jgi:hypothetical protein
VNKTPAQIRADHNAYHGPDVSIDQCLHANCVQLMAELQAAQRKHPAETKILDSVDGTKPQGERGLYLVEGELS